MTDIPPESGITADSFWGQKVRPTIRRPWAFRTALGILAFGLFSNLMFLYHHCPFDLTEDESHYWLWSKHLAWGYYSKGPGIAAIIHAAIVVGRWFGATHATMPVIRTPAVIFACISGLASLVLARRMFRDDRTCLMLMVLSAGMPVFAIGSLLMTIDSPMYLSWALASLCVWLAVEPNRDKEGNVVEQPGKHASAWWLYLAGLLAGLGILCKPIPLFLVPSLVLAAIFNSYLRQKLATWHSLGAVLLMLAIQIPTLVWNAAHNWVMFRHIGGEGGLEGHFNMIKHLEHIPAQVGLYLGSQAGICAGIVFVLLILAFVDAVKICRRQPAAVETAHWALLLSLALPLFGFYFVLSLWTKVQPNWPAAGYFSAMILLAGVATLRWNRPRENKLYRRWLITAVVFGFCLYVLAENTQRFYPLAARLDPTGTKFPAVRWDPAFRLHDLRIRGLAVNKVRMSMRTRNGQLPLVIADRWDEASSISFYLPGHPFVYCIQSLTGGRESQFNLWPGIDQINPSTGKLRFAGRNAVLIGWFSPSVFHHLILPAFTRVGKMRMIHLYYHGVFMKGLALWKCYGFKGFPHSAGKAWY